MLINYYNDNKIIISLEIINLLIKHLLNKYYESRPHT